MKAKLYVIGLLMVMAFFQVSCGKDDGNATTGSASTFSLKGAGS